MKVLVTGSAGRVGRAIYIHLARSYHVVGLDSTPCSTADFIGDIRDEALLHRALKGVDVVVHTAALHAPHIGHVSDEMFHEVNVVATTKLAELAVANGVKQFVFTSTTALYGHASTPNGRAGWVTEQSKPLPKTIYHHTKIAAEVTLEAISNARDFPVTVLQMSRCFPEPVEQMAQYRLNRGIDYRDVASAHRCAIEKRLPGFNRFIISGKTPFDPSCCEQLFNDCEAVLRVRSPKLVAVFEQRGWSLPQSLDRVYDSSKAQSELGWTSKYGFESVIDLYDDGFAEVLPSKNQSSG
ncbi:NAD-dependent epimerase/dehydratase family protein [Pseudoalteromonas umbrosa]|uniref:NAD-dependent epimerase/dehydratase family protein n=1 Tax=Pseudoalteromonas umbrosa TaxID=3048489 RepID=UPI0024C2E3E5|nr:NAD(P)-dependent oxidoreductase [Pseudoalteromonas sp. B95]MDK1286220.1 NAD(P)-dependent oxidoreductase [Pseudoalteromonas sp. B95]